MKELRVKKSKTRHRLTPPNCQPAPEAGKKSGNTPRCLRDKIIQQYLTGHKTTVMLAREYEMKPATIRAMVLRYKKRNIAIFDQTPKLPPMRKNMTGKELNAQLMQENEDLHRQLQLAKIQLEGYRIMGDILEDEYGIDLLKKSVAKRSPVSKNDTQK